jgi:hypothetical protein
VHTKEICNLYCPPNIIRTIKSGRIRWTHAALGAMRHAYESLVGKHEETAFKM